MFDNIEFHLHDNLTVDFMSVTSGHLMNTPEIILLFVRKVIVKG